MTHRLKINITCIKADDTTHTKRCAHYTDTKA